MQMVHLLTAVRPSVEQGLESTGRAFGTVLIPASVLFGELRGKQEHFT
jgi:hypothetical protein